MLDYLFHFSIYLSINFCHLITNLIIIGTIIPAIIPNHNKPLPLNPPIVIRAPIAIQIQKTTLTIAFKPFPIFIIIIYKAIVLYIFNKFEIKLINQLLII